MMQPILSLRGLSKSFPGVKALEGVSLNLFAGRVTALIGENGAGKSTLVKLMTGIHQPDEGEILIDGEPVHLNSAEAAQRAGITAIHQETVLFDDLDVAENIFIGHAPRGRFGLIDRASMRRRAAELLASIGAEIPVTTRLRDLGIASRHMVAIARALSVEARVVIMDEPTAALSQKEIEELFELILKLRAQGKAVLFISHKFDEIFRIAEDFVVCRGGQPAGEGRLAETTPDELVRMMVGRSIDQIFPDRKTAKGEAVLSVENLGHPTEFTEISFTLHRGEILGFYGLVGAGRTEVMQAIFGVTRPDRGSIRLDGKALAIRSPADAIAAGIVYVPEDRGRQGAVKGLGVFQNVTLPSLRETTRAGFLNLAREFARTRDYTARLDLRAASLDQDVALLSGGNQQKVVVAKWLATRPRVIILDEPTKGIDIGSKAAVHGFMADLAAEGLAVIMVSSEIPEIMGMSDRVMVMREGRIAAELAGAGMTPETLVRAAAGIRDAA